MPSFLEVATGFDYGVIFRRRSKGVHVACFTETSGPVFVLALQREARRERLLQGLFLRGLRPASSTQTGTGGVKGQDQNIYIKKAFLKRTVESGRRFGRMRGEIVPRWVFYFANISWLP